MRTRAPTDRKALEVEAGLDPWLLVAVGTEDASAHRWDVVPGVGLARDEEVPALELRVRCGRWQWVWESWGCLLRTLEELVEKVEHVVTDAFLIKHLVPRVL